MNITPPPKLSICIPSYNRPGEIADLLRNIAQQGKGSWNVFISEDCSPKGEEIAEAVRRLAVAYPSLEIHFSQNKRNLGYDGNLRHLFDLADGDYCVIMGDDDLLVDGALQRITHAVSRPGVGYVLRAWRSIDKGTGRPIEDFRYFTHDRLFSPGVLSAAALYRRSVFISGLVFHRESALKLHTSQFDGRLLYQLYLVGRLLQVMSGYYISDLTVLRRSGGDHFFGSSESERHRFKPKELSITHSLNFVRGMFDIARALDEQYCPGLLDTVTKDIGRYSFPILAIQSAKISRVELIVYAGELARIGLGKSWMFWAYVAALLSIGPTVSINVIRIIKRVLGRTPNLGGSSGTPIS